MNIMCVHECECVCVHMHICSCACGGQRIALGIISQELPAFVFIFIS